MNCQLGLSPGRVNLVIARQLRAPSVNECRETPDPWSFTKCLPLQIYAVVAHSTGWAGAVTAAMIYLAKARERDLLCTSSDQDDFDSLNQDREVQPQRQVLHVKEIKLQLPLRFLDARSVVVTHLRPPC